MDYHRKLYSVVAFYGPECHDISVCTVNGESGTNRISDTNRHPRVELEALRHVHRNPEASQRWRR